MEKFKSRFIASNNVGVEIAKIFFVSIAYCPWCARRAIAFIAISTSYQGLSNHKVHFEPKSVFQEVPL